jgi:hypothetical protein
MGAVSSYNPTKYSANFCMRNGLLQVRESRSEKGTKDGFHSITDRKGPEGE